MQTPGQHRARYFELMDRAKARAGLRPMPTPPLGDVIGRQSVPAGWYDSVYLARGQTLRLIDADGGNGVALLLWNARDASERLNVGDTMKLQWTAAITAGHLLLSDMGRVLTSITASDPGARLDLLAGGGGDGLRSNESNFRLIAAKHGLSVRDVPPCVTLFADLRTDDDGRFVWGGSAPAGSAIDLRAEMDVLVGVSNCPHPLAPQITPRATAEIMPGAIEIVTWRAPPPPPDDPCRTAGEEAIRAFENTAAYLAQLGVPL